jgi:hypothetical protein
MNLLWKFVLSERFTFNSVSQGDQELNDRALADFLAQL